MIGNFTKPANTVAATVATKTISAPTVRPASPTIFVNPSTTAANNGAASATEKPVLIVPSTSAATTAAAIATAIPGLTQPESTVTPNGQATIAKLGLQELELAGTPATVYIPASLKPQQAAQVIIAIHGMHGQGGAICNGLISFAEKNGVVLLAPTFNYNENYQNPQTVSTEDGVLTKKLNQMVSELGTLENRELKKRLLLYGFSRGAQLAHRYALLYPDRTLGVAALSAGSYTLPFEFKGSQPMPFPFGVSDVQQYTGKPFNQTSFNKVSFWIEVGAQDNDPNQTPRAWDEYEGRSRVERAERFYQALKQLGVNAHYMAFENTGHQETPAMRETATKFFLSLIAV